MEQAGGLQRMTLRGHTAGLQKVLLSPSGIDVITGGSAPTAACRTDQPGLLPAVTQGGSVMAELPAFDTAQEYPCHVDRCTRQYL